MIRPSIALAGLFILSCLGGLSMAGHVQTSHAPPKYQVDLDLPPEKRWVHVMQDFPNVINNMIDFLSKYIPRYLFPLLDKIGVLAETVIGQPYAGEMRGIAKSLNTSIGNIVLMNLVYDFSAFCTSIVCQDSNNTIWHARNLDYGTSKNITHMLTDYMIETSFISDGKVQYTTVGPVGYIGAVTGQKPHVFTISIDQRFSGSILWNLAIAILDRKAIPMAFLVRNALEASRTFEEALNILQSPTTAAPVYFIVGGVRPGEGAVITKDRFKTTDLWRLNETASRWYMVETNFDHWVNPIDRRRQTAIEELEAIGPANISVTTLKRVLNKFPVHNQDTVYTAIMTAGDPSKLSTWVWD